MPTFEVPGAELAVALSDEGGHPVVQLHGLTSSRARDRVLNLDLGRGLSGTRLLRYDARGHGRSTGRKVADDYRWPNLADDLLRLLDHWFPGERVHGVGPSMGAATLLHAASLEPDRFTGLTLMVPPTGWKTRPDQVDSYRAAAALIEADGVEAFLASMRGSSGDLDGARVSSRSKAMRRGSSVTRRFFHGAAPLELLGAGASGAPPLAVTRLRARGATWRWRRSARRPAPARCPRR